jgi:MFS family permease
LPFLVLAGIVLAEGVFVGGILPLIHETAAGLAAWIYATYFAGLVLGQLAVVRWPGVSSARYAYPACVMLFGAAAWLMGHGLAVSPTALIAGRALEGLAAGLGLPLAFATALALPAFGDARRRLAIFNSTMAVGFVAGPPVVAALLGRVLPGDVLAGAGLLFLGLALLAGWCLPAVEAGEAGALTFPAGWFEDSFTLFLAKCFYGFFLASMAGSLVMALHPLGVAQAMVLVAVVFVVGQAGATQVARHVPFEHQRVYVPLLLSAVLLGVAVWPAWILAAALVHSWLLYVGYAGAIQPGGARAFARINLASDPGLLLGALLAGAGSWGLGGLAALGLLPLLQVCRRPAALFRAEHFHPFVGPVLLQKVLAKHRAPLRERRDWPADAPIPRFDHPPAATEGRQGACTAPLPQGDGALTLAFAGDWAPLPTGVSLSPEVRAFLLRHDVRLVNFEAAMTGHGRGAGMFFDMPPDQFAAVQGEPPAFNVCTCVNNHVLDAGVPAVDATERHLAHAGVVPVLGDMRVMEVSGVRVGCFARTFGANTAWRRHPRIRVLKPERLLADEAARRALLDEVAAYRAQVDVLVMSYHWGYESEFWPSACQRACWELLREAGVDVLFGHHSHIVQPAEVGPDGEGLCLYSCGNLAVDMPLPVYSQGALFSVALARPAQPGGRWRVQRLETCFLQRDNHEIAMVEPGVSDVWRHWEGVVGAG